MNQLFKNTLAISEDTVRRVLATTIRDPESPFFAKPLTVDGLWDQPAALVWLAEMGAVYFIPESKYYKSEELIGLFKEICVAAETAVHEDGTNDLIISNFRQPEYFHFPLLCQVYRQFEKIGQPTEKEAEAAAKLYYLIERLSQGLLNSGFHTPNHRWVHTSALCYAYNTLKVKDQRFMDLAEKYLAEKIDIDEFGEFSERSAGMYSAISDRALCGIAGFLLTAGTNHTLTTTLVDGRGFTAVMVSWLAKFNPIFMIFASFLLVFLDRGAGDISSKFGLNQSFSDIITGVILFFIIGSEFFITYKITFRKHAVKEEKLHV